MYFTWLSERLKNFNLILLNFHSESVLVLDLFSEVSSLNISFITVLAWNNECILCISLSLVFLNDFRINWQWVRQISWSVLYGLTVDLELRDHFRCLILERYALSWFINFDSRLVTTVNFNWHPTILDLFMYLNVDSSILNGQLGPRYKGTRCNF